MKRVDPKAPTARYKAVDPERKDRTTGTHRAVSSTGTHRAVSTSPTMKTLRYESKGKRIRRKAEQAERSAEPRSGTHRAIDTSGSHRAVRSASGSSARPPRSASMSGVFRRPAPPQQRVDELLNSRMTSLSGVHTPVPAQRGSRSYRFGSLLGALLRRMPKPPSMRRSIEEMTLGALGALAAIVMVAGVQLSHTAVRESKAYELESLEFTGLERVGAGSMESDWGAMVGRNVLFMDLPSIEANMERHPWIADVSIEKTARNRLRAHVREHNPVLLFVHPDDGLLWLVDDEGEPFKVLERDDPADLPVVTGIDNDELSGDSPGCRPLLQRARFAMEALAGRGFDTSTVSTIDINGDGTLVANLDSGTELHLGSDRFLERAARLVTLVERGLLDPDRPKRVRLNLENQVVVGPLNGA